MTGLTIDPTQSIEVVDALGHVSPATFVEEKPGAGIYLIEWSGHPFSVGIDNNRIRALVGPDGEDSVSVDQDLIVRNVSG